MTFYFCNAVNMEEGLYRIRIIWLNHTLMRCFQSCVDAASAFSFHFWRRFFVWLCIIYHHSHFRGFVLKELPDQAPVVFWWFDSSQGWWMLFSQTWGVWLVDGVWRWCFWPGSWQAASPTAAPVSLMLNYVEKKIPRPLNTSSWSSHY